MGMARLSGGYTVFVRSSRSGVAVEEFAFDGGEGDGHLLEEDEVVVHEVGGFVDKAVAVAVDGFDAGFDGFFAYFLGDFFYPFDEEACGVGVLGHLGVTARDE